MGSGYFENCKIYSIQDLINYVKVNKVKNSALLKYVQSMKDVMKKDKNKGKFRDPLYGFAEVSKKYGKNESKKFVTKSLNVNKHKNSDEKADKSYYTFGNSIIPCSFDN